jgi:hypothetical protein
MSALKVYLKVFYVMKPNGLTSIASISKKLSACLFSPEFLKMEALCSSKRLPTFQSTLLHDPDDQHAISSKWRNILCVWDCITIWLF